jgi:hypothetical protein
MLNFPQAYSNPELVDERDILRKMFDLENLLKRAKPTEASELARRYAIVVTDLEKVIAYFQAFVVER